MATRNLEKVVESYLVKRVEALGGKAYKWTSPSNRGVCDRIVFVNNQIWFIELKRDHTCKLSKLQELFRDFILKYTDNYAVLSSKDEVDKWLKTIC